MEPTPHEDSQSSCRLKMTFSIYRFGARRRNRATSLTPGFSDNHPFLFVSVAPSENGSLPRNVCSTIAQRQIRPSACHRSSANTIIRKNGQYLSMSMRDNLRTPDDLIVRLARAEDSPCLHELHTQSIRALCAGHYSEEIIDATEQNTGRIPAAH
jgi:hypothetical protein